MRVAGPFDPAVVFTALFAEEPYAFWVDGPIVWLGVGDQVSAYTVPDVRDPSGFSPDMCSVLASRELPELRECRDHRKQAMPGGWVGYLGYGVKAITRGGAAHPRQGGVPDAQWMRATRVIGIDPVTGDAEVSAIDDDAWVSATAAALRSLVGSVGIESPTTSLEESSGTGITEATLGGVSSRERGGYLDDIEACREHLRRGESYEICLTRTISLPPVGDPLTLHRLMRAGSPTGRSVYLRFAELAVCSATPEEFLTVTSDGRVRARPIKGTAPRGADSVADAGGAAILAADPKSRAENLMIVDLLRNDLHQVCVPGSVRVPGLIEVETYATVHQLVSTITGQLADGRTGIDAVRAAFPPGSMTGAPKERTMAIIDALEPEPRGIYSGAIGVLGGDGSVDLRVVIRTAVCTPERVTIGTGGAITWLSDAEAEWEETVLKARAPLAAYAAARKNGAASSAGQT